MKMNHSRWIIHVAISLALVVSSLSYGSAQPVNGGGGTITPPPAILNDKNFRPSMLVVIIVLIAAFFFMGFFSIYLRQCVGEGQSGIGGSIRSAANIGRRSRRVQKGLDPAVIDTFPTFLYSVVKGLKIGKGTLECAVCLNEFEDDETLRLLPKCDHVFHPECIDAWLGSHTTCPVCRSNLNEDSAASADGDDQNQNQTLESDAATTGTETLTGRTGVGAELAGSVDQSRQQQPEINECQEQVLIRVNDSEQEGSEHHQDSVQIPRQNRSKSTRKPKINAGKFPRSHSTGHSLVQPGENVDRFTLRLPVDVRKKIVESELNRSASYANSQTRLKSSGSVRPGVNRSGKYFQFGRLDRAAKSDHWGFKLTVPFFTRNASVRSSGKADGAVNLPLDSVGAKVDGTSTSVAANRPPV